MKPQQVLSHAHITVNTHVAYIIDFFCVLVIITLRRTNHVLKMLEIVLLPFFG